MTTANADQHVAWNGESGERWVASADRRDAMLAPIADLLLDAATIAEGEQVLDVGCGCGATALAAAAATGPTGAVLGADLSAPMLEVAGARADGHGNVEFRQADVQTDPLGGPFDVAISRFGTMFFDDPTTAFANVARHLRPGGRLCIATWQPLVDNQWLVVPGTALLEFGSPPEAPDPTGPGMFALADPATIRSVLAGGGFGDIATRGHTLPLRFGTTVADAVDHLADSGPGRAVLDTIAEDDRPAALAAVADAVRAHVDPEGRVSLDAAIWITTAVK